MLKWTVTNKRVGESDIEPLRRLADPAYTDIVPERRRSASKTGKIATRRSAGSSVGKVGNKENRRSLGHSVVKRANIKSLRNKENHYTSTPNIESSTYIRFESVALRDVSNITPTNTPTTPNRLPPTQKPHGLRTAPQPAKNNRQSAQKRTFCQTHDEHYVPHIPIDTPKTHRVKGYPQINVNFDEKFCMEEKPLMRSNYAATLPAFQIDYSPCSMRQAQNIAKANDHVLGYTNHMLPTFTNLNPIYFADREPPNKKPKMNEDVRLPKRCCELKSTKEVTISPLTNKLADLRFSRISYNKQSDDVSPVSNDVNENNISAERTHMGDVTLDNMIDAILASAKISPSLYKVRLAEINLDNSREILNDFVNINVENKDNLIKHARTRQITTNDKKYVPCSTSTLHQKPAEVIKNTSSVSEGTAKLRRNSDVLKELNTYNEREVKTPESKSNTNTIGMATVLKNQLEQIHISTESKHRKRSNPSSNIISKMAESPVNSSLTAYAECNLKRMKCVRRRRDKDHVDDNSNRINGLTLPNGIPSPESACKIIKTPVLNTVHEAKDRHIGLTLPNGIPSPESLSTLTKHIKSNLSNSSLMLGQHSAEKTSNENLEIGVQSLGATLIDNPNNNDELNEPSTPIPDDKRFKSRRCLTYSPEDSYEKRRSVASSTTSRSCKGHTVKGTLDLSMFVTNGQLNVHVIRGRDFQRSGGKPVNAYVKVALSSAEKNDTGFQRTAVHRDSTKPNFDHRFTFDLSKTDLQKRLQIAVWHRDREYRRSEFLGCMSFAVKHAVKKDISGSFRLLPQLSGRSQNLAVTAPTNTTNTSQQSHHEAAIAETTNIQQIELSRLPQLSGKMGENTQSGSEELVRMGEMGEGAAEGKGVNKKSMHQKDADENLFLRYLELDPVDGPDAPLAAIQKKASGNKSGRTPFTTTKRLTRPDHKGFGFSIVWTHPPRVERIEPGLSADKAGILPGDYVIFVDKHNVVTMPEVEVLNLIKSFGKELTLEIFRRTAHNGMLPKSRTESLEYNLTQEITDIVSFKTNQAMAETFLENRGTRPFVPVVNATPGVGNIAPPRSSTACSATTTQSLDLNRRRLHLPQVTFSKESTTLLPLEEQRRRAIYQLINKEQHYATALQFGVTRFASPLAERGDLLSPADHHVLFQNVEELLRLTEDILDHVTLEDGEPQTQLVVRMYLSKMTSLTTMYKRYCNGLKKADCVLVNKTKNPSSDFVRFLQEPPIPRRRPDITSFIHKPLEHFREIFQLLQTILSYTKPNSNPDEFVAYSKIVHEMQVAYRDITMGGGLMEPVGEGKPLLSLQDLESRLVFTKCKPFVLNSSGRQWIFGGDLSRIEGRSVRPYWALLFSDILLFAKVSRDRVLFITEEPLPLLNITDTCFNVRKKNTEFRITIDPSGRLADSPTAHCGPDLTRTPRKNARRRSVVLRAPTMELKAVWQNLLQRQIFHVNSVAGSTPQSSPLESPDAHPIMTSSVATLHSMDSYHGRQTPQPIDCQNHKTSSKRPTMVEEVTQKNIAELIDNKCRQLGKTVTGRGGAIHLAQWMKGNLVDDGLVDELENEDFQVWSKEELKRRSMELNLIEETSEGVTVKRTAVARRCDSRCEEIVLSEGDQSPSRSTTSDSQVTVRSSPVVPETVQVCRQCHKTCFSKPNSPSFSNHVNNNMSVGQSNGSKCKNCGHFNKIRDHGQNLDNRIKNNLKDKQDLNQNDDNENEDWGPLILMGLTAFNPAASVLKFDPFAPAVPTISVLPPSPDNLMLNINKNHVNWDGSNKYNSDANVINDNYVNKENGITENCLENSPDDSPQDDAEPPYVALSGANGLKRFGTLSSLERMPSDEVSDEKTLEDGENSSEEDIDDEVKGGDSHNQELLNDENAPATGVRGWTARAGSYMVEKMSLFERLGYLRPAEATRRPEDEDDGEGETSGATSGEEIWGTPTSGEENDDLQTCTNSDGATQSSPTRSTSSATCDEDTELMMDDLLMAPPMTAATLRGLLPRRRLEPLMEEEDSDTDTTSSDPAQIDDTPSPEQGSAFGNAADISFPALSPKLEMRLALDHDIIFDDDLSFYRQRSPGGLGRGGMPLDIPGYFLPPDLSRYQKLTTQDLLTRAINRKIISQNIIIRPNRNTSNSFASVLAEKAVDPHHLMGTETVARRQQMSASGSFPSVPRQRKIGRDETGIQARKSSKLFGFLKTRNNDRQLLKIFTKESNEIAPPPTSHLQKPFSPRSQNDKQLDRRFWKQLRRRRGSLTNEIPAT